MTTTVVLIKNFDEAKQRLATLLSSRDRRQLAMSNARLALRAAREAGPTLSVCSSAEAAALAETVGVTAIREVASRGQNLAAVTGIEAAVGDGATSVLILSSDLPLVDTNALCGLRARASDSNDRVVVAAAAHGRQGTNGLLLRPPLGIDLVFGEDSLRRFQLEAARRQRRFLVHHDPRLALDLDDGNDLVRLEQMRASA